MSRSVRIEPSQLFIRYVLALTLLVAFVLGGHGLQVITSKQGALDEEVINISGRQRMLSQRIVLVAQRYVATEDPEYRAILSESIGVFSTSHDWIVNNALHEGTPVFAHYFDPSGAQLDKASKEFIRLAERVASMGAVVAESVRMTQELEDAALVDLLASLNMAVGLFEASANQRTATLEYLQYGVLAATLIVLLLEVGLIFYPTHQALVGMIKRLRYQAWYDQLTGLINRSEFISRTQSMLDACPENDSRIVILALDLDGFKQINDTLGHPAGDQVLQQASAILQGTLNAQKDLDECHLSRTGGDEFLISMRMSTATAKERADEIGWALIQNLQKPLRVCVSPGQFANCSVGVSVGFSIIEPGSNDLEEAVSNADIALYVSKRGGKGIVTPFVQEMGDKIRRENDAKHELKVAIRGLEFVPYFQPQIDLKTGKLAGVEALARWNHPKRGILPPSEFVGLAENLKLVDALDGQVILRAFQEYNYCKDRGIDLGKLSINTSGSALRDPDFCSVLSKVATAHGIDPARVTIEILENILVEDEGDPSIETIRQLSQAGFGVAIDDFGVGFSSLARVGYLSISAIKLDKTLVARAGDDSMAKILRATVNMADGLGAQVIAEGIETEIQRGVMQSLGTDVGQGYLWSPPLTTEDLCTWVRQNHVHHIRAV